MWSICWVNLEEEEKVRLMIVLDKGPCGQCVCLCLLKQMKIDFMCLGSIMRRVIEVPMIIMGGLQIATGSKRDDKIGLFQN